MPHAVIPESQLQDCLQGGLHWSATKHTAASLERAMGHYHHLAGHGFHHLPFFLIADLTELVESGLGVSFSSESGISRWSDAERALRLQVENRLLGRLLGEPRIQEVLELLQNHRSDSGLLSAAFIGRARRLMSLLLRCFAPHYPAQVRINPAHLRGFPAPSLAGIAQAHERFVAAVDDPEFFSRRLSTMLSGIAEQVEWGAILQTEDVFELQHHDILSEPAQRIGCRQIIEVSRRLGEIDPRQVAVAEDGAAETAFVDESEYPTGGLAGLTNRGSMENLVLSELVYIDPDMEIDLFDLRYLEGELLYYLRDDGILRRKRRTVSLFVDPAPILLQKPRGYPFQLSIIVQGLVLRMVHDLVEVFTDDAILFNIHYLHAAGDINRWRDELALLKLLLRDELAQGWIKLHLTPRRPPSQLLDLIDDPKRKQYLIAVSAEQQSEWQQTLDDALNGQPPLYGLPLLIGSASPGTLCLPLEGASFSDLADLKNKMVGMLVGLKSGRRSHG